MSMMGTGFRVWTRVGFLPPFASSSTSTERPAYQFSIARAVPYSNQASTTSTHGTHPQLAPRETVGGEDLLPSCNCKARVEVHRRAYRAYPWGYLV